MITTINTKNDVCAFELNYTAEVQLYRVDLIIIMSNDLDHLKCLTSIIITSKVTDVIDCD
jgi:hypothetical protein